MIYTDLTKKAMRIAFDAHYGQVDKGGTPYICHPLHVAEGMTDEIGVSIALLHDVLEDTDVTELDLEKEEIPSIIIAGVLVLTRDKKIPYSDYITRIVESNHPYVKQVKLRDLEHNLDLSRIQPENFSKTLYDRYIVAKKRIEESMK